MRALVVYNNFSGKNKIAKKIGYICERLKTKYDIVECFRTRGPKSITEHIISSGASYDLIIVAGGDGSVHEAINGMMKSKTRPTLAFIPMGTCNDAASTLGLRKNIKRTIDKILDEKVSLIDVCKINNEYFMYGLAAGCLTEISYDATHKSKKNMGRFAYYLQGLKSYSNTKTITLSLNSDEHKITGSFSLFLALNSRYLAGFKIHRRKKIYLDDGKLRVTMIIKTNKLRNIFDFGMFLLIGERYKHNILNFDVSKMRISSENEISYNTDGEQFGKFREINVEVMPKAISLVTSKRVKRRHFLY